MPGRAGIRNRNFPSRGLSEALEIAQAIQDGASGKRIGKLALAKLVGRSPGAKPFRDLILACRAYGLTNGGVNGDEFELTPLGHEVTGPSLRERKAALRKAVLNIAPYRAFLTAYDQNKVPADAAFREFLVKTAGVSEEWAPDCIEHLLDDARLAGLLDRQKTGEWVDLSGGAQPLASDGPKELTNIDASDDDHDVDDGSTGDGGLQTGTTNGLRDETLPPSKPKRVFVAHGKNGKPLEQLKTMLSELGVGYVVAVDEAHGGRPISEKVAKMMREDCSSAIFIFSADERFLREGPDGQTTEVWRPSENVVYELGAASVLYGRRIILFKEDRVTLPSDFSDLGHIGFHGDQIDAQWPQLLRELKALGMVEIRVTA